MWKKIVLGLLAFIVIAIALALYFTKTISEVADKQLEALRKGDVTTAYSYGSKDFKASTSLPDFENFLNAYPSLKNNKSTSWSSREINNNTGTLMGSLTSTDGAVTPIEYHFVKENGDWKILGLQLHQTGATIVNQSPTNQEQSKATSKTTGDIKKGEIYQILVSDAMNAKGNVEATKKIIPAKSPKVYVSTYILHAKKGLTVTAEMVRVANGAKIGPSVATVTKNGNVIRDFSFTNTETIWPAGDYKINVTTSNGQTSTVPFVIQ